MASACRTSILSPPPLSLLTSPVFAASTPFLSHPIPFLWSSWRNQHPRLLYQLSIVDELMGGIHGGSFSQVYVCFVSLAMRGSVVRSRKKVTPCPPNMCKLANIQKPGTSFLPANSGDIKFSTAALSHRSRPETRSRLSSPLQAFP